jgi:hypothetical protein
MSGIDGNASMENADGNGWGTPGNAAAQSGSAASANSDDEAAGASSAEDVMSPEVAKLAESNRNCGKR